MGLIRGLLVGGLFAALAMSPATVALAQDADPPREEACDRSQAPPGRPPFCEEYPPPRRDVACDRSQAPPGRPPFCQASSMAPGSRIRVVLSGPLSSERSDTDAAQASAREYTIEADEAGLASFQAPPGLEPGRYEVTFQDSAAEVDPQPRTQAFQVVTVATMQPAPAAATSEGAVATNGILFAAGSLVVVLGGVVAVRRRRRRVEIG